MKNWKTTVAGIITGSIVILQSIAVSLQSGTAINWWQLAIGFAVMALGVVSKDFDVIAVAPFFLIPLFSGCASTQVQLVSATLSNGDQFPLCIEVSEKTTLGFKLIAAFCATAQQEIDVKAAEYRKLFPNAAITQYTGKEAKQLN